jgi:DNA polymerase-3 subunit gamma/tau
MSLIKLTYLQQAIEVVGNGEGISKKKISANTSVNFRSLPVIRWKERKEESSPVKELHKPVLIIEQEPKKVVPEPTEVEKSPPSFGSLARIRQKINEQKEGDTGARVLTKETVEEAWHKYIEKLEVNKNHSAVTNFRMCELRVAEQNCIEVVVNSLFHQKFIEVERSALVDHLQGFFRNNRLIYQFIIEEKEQPGEPAEKQLSKKQQYQKLIQKYPMIKELKDRLKLDLG